MVSSIFLETVKLTVFIIYEIMDDGSFIQSFILFNLYFYLIGVRDFLRFDSRMESNETGVHTIGW